MNPLAAVTFLRAHWRPLALAALLAASFAAGYHSAPRPAIHEKLDEKAQQAKAKQSEKDTASETDKQSGPTRKVVLEFDPHCPPTQQVRLVPGQPLPPSIIRETVIETGPTQVVTRAATEARSAEQEHAEQDRHLDLTVKPAADPRWALQVGLEDVLNARTVRVAGRLRVVGPLWAELSVIPASRGVGLAVAAEW